MRWACGYFFLVATVTFAEPPKVPPLIEKQAGTLPIIISCPHDGTLPIADVPVRSGTNIEKFVTVRDTDSSLVSEELAKELEKKWHAKPYLIIARFSRKYLDVNRPTTGAFEDPQAKPVYDEYHQFLKEACQNIQQKHRRGLLLDIHGQAAERDTVFRGTNNLKTVKVLLDRYGKPAINGEKSILGHLSRNGVKVFPPIDSDEAENKSFSGGYIVQTYGSHTAYAIDAIQLETGGNQRIKNRREFVLKLTDAVTAFATEYLPIDAKPTDPKSKP